MTQSSPLLDVDNFTLAFGAKTVVSNVSFQVKCGEVLCLVGESGCGKSLTALSVLGLQPENSSVLSGSIKFQDRDIVKLSPKELQNIRGQDISMVFQEPMTSLNPVLRVGEQVAEPLMVHRGLSRKLALVEAEKLLLKVGIPSPASRLNDYPHQLSGGMRQRVMIAMALACGPKLLLADEPTTALDVTIQGQILRLLLEAKNEHEGQGMGLMLITHDLGLVKEMADQIAVMYAGEIVEYAPAKEFFASPRHPYSTALLNCAPTITSHQAERLTVIPGMVPEPDKRPAGCAFAPRCTKAFAQCTQSPPLMDMPSQSHYQVRCWLYNS